MKRLAYLTTICIMLLTACSDDGAFGYKEDISLCPFSINLFYTDKGDTVTAPAGLRVELKDPMGSIFVDSTDNSGIAHFLVTPGIYEASSSNNYIDSTGTDWYRYIFNGIQSLIVISPDSTNQRTLRLTMSRKRIVH